MGFKKVGAAATAPVAAPTPATEPPKAAAAKPRIRAATPATVAPAADPTPIEAAIEAAPAEAPKPKGIVPRSGPAASKIAPTPKADPTAPPAADDDADPLAWTHQGDEALAIAAAAEAKRAEEKEERRARGYWPQRFELIPPGTASRGGVINDRYQADIILLDAKMGPSFFEHVLKNARTGRYDVIEPCPKEFDNCPICPPAGERESMFVSLLSALNINGYTIKTGDRAGQHVPITKELLAPWASDLPFFAELLKEHGTLRGIQLTMTRGQKSDPRIGTPTFVGIHSDEEIEAYIKSQGMWAEKVTREGEKIGDEDWLMHPFNYAEFLHRPSGADLRARYTGSAVATGGAPIGSRSAGADGQWGGGRYAPGAAGGPTGKAPTGFDDLDDDVPF